MSTTTVTPTTTGTLTEQQVRQFIVDGYLVIRPDLAPDFHEQVHRRATVLHEASEAVLKETGDPTLLEDNLRPQLPELDVLFAHEAVRGAIVSLLGPDALLHPHSHLHTSSSADQLFHKDSSARPHARAHIRSHRPMWVLCGYYPQDTTLELGPTEVIPGSQYWTVDWPIGRDGEMVGEDSPGGVDEFTALRVAPIEERERILAAQLARLGHSWLQPRMVTVPAGSVVLYHHDLFHRGTRRLTEAGPHRYLIKFIFARTREPNGPSWQADDGDDTFPAEPAELQRVWRHMRASMAGDRTPLPPPVEPVADLTRRLVGDTEAVRMDAAYGLADVVRAGGSDADAALDALVATFQSGVESHWRCAAYGLAAAGPVVLDAMAPLLAAGPAWARAHAAFVIGEIGDTPAAARLLARSLDDDDALVRSCGAHALGRLAQTAIGRDDEAVWAMASVAVARRLDPAVEPSLPTSKAYPLSTVRESLTHALVNITTLDDHQIGWITDDIVDAAARTLVDPDRYVQGCGVDAVHRLLRILPDGHPQVGSLRERWGEFLMARRWSA